VCGAHPIKMIVAWLVPNCAIKGKSQKGLKDNQGWEKPIKKTHLYFVLLKRNIFLLKKNNTKIHSELLIVSVASCNITMITHALLRHSNLRANNYTPSLFSQSVVGQWYGLARMHTANSEEPLPHNLCSFTSSLCTCPASSAYST